MLGAGGDGAVSWLRAWWKQVAGAGAGAGRRAPLVPGAGVSWLCSRCGCWRCELGVRAVHGDRVSRVSVLLAVRVPVPVLGAGWLAVCVARGGDRAPVLRAGCVL